MARSPSTLHDASLLLPRVVVLVDDMWGIGEYDEELGVLVVVERYSSFRKARAAL